MITDAPNAEKKRRSLVVDPEWIRQKLAEADALYGPPPALEPGMTAEKLRDDIAASLRARGIDPDSIRYEQKYEGE